MGRVRTVTGVLRALRDPKIRRRGWRVRRNDGLIRDRYGCCPLVALARSRGARGIAESNDITAAIELGIDGEVRRTIVFAADDLGPSGVRANLIRALGILP